MYVDAPWKFLGGLRGLRGEWDSMRAGASLVTLDGDSLERARDSDSHDNGAWLAAGEPRSSGQYYGGVGGTGERTVPLSLGPGSAVWRLAVGGWRLAVGGWREVAPHAQTSGQHRWLI